MFFLLFLQILTMSVSLFQNNYFRILFIGDVLYYLSELDKVTFCTWLETTLKVPMSIKLSLEAKLFYN